MKVTEAMIKAAAEELPPAASADIRRALSAALEVMEAEQAPVTEEPPVGTKLIDCDGDIWERTPKGWMCGGAGLLTAGWDFVKVYAPLRPAP